MSSHDKNCPSNLLLRPSNKILKMLILGGGPIGLFAGYKMLKKGHNVTIFEKRNKYTRHNIMSLKTTRELDTLSIMPSEIMDELNTHSSYANLVKNSTKCVKNICKSKSHLMLSSRIYYFVLNEFENAYEKYFNLCGGHLIRPTEVDAYSNITVQNNIISYSEKDKNYTIDMSIYDIIFINDGANSYYRNIYFDKTSFIEPTENNVYRYGLTEKGDTIKVSHDKNDIRPLAYGMILIYNIQNKTEFKQKFHTEEKINRSTNVDTAFELHNVNDKFLNGMTIKEILIKNIEEQKTNTTNSKSQNLIRMFVSENYLYISIMVNPKDVGDYSQKLQEKITFDSLPNNIKMYISFALYYYDLSELIDPMSENTIIKLFPLFFNCVRQSCTFTPSIQETSDNNKKILFLLCGDAMASGNFHAGIVLNRNLIAVNHICQLVDEYIDSYPKLEDDSMDDRFMKLLFFNGNLSNQIAIDEIIKKSIDVLINFSALDKDDFTFNLADIIRELGDIILCKNCSSKDKLMCKNSFDFINFLLQNSNNEALHRILKYLFLPDKYTQFAPLISSMLSG